MAEPHDDHVYLITLWTGSLRFYLAAIEFYGNLLNSDVEAIDADPDLHAILGEENRRDFEIHHELERVEHAREWIDEKLKSGKSHHFIHIAHGSVRFIKATGSLYLKHLQNRRNALANRPNISKHALQAVDTRIASLQETVTMGVFQDATPMPLLVNEVLDELPSVAPSSVESLARAATPRPVVLSSIEILDSDLRSRCLDLFDSFETSGRRDRMDTVVSEATRVLEDKLRKLVGAADEIAGLELVKHAFGGEPPRLRVSNVPAEQQAAASLFRGVFGLIRNVAHHRLVGEIQPERVLQVMGMIDYCLAIAQGAKREE